MCPLCQFSNQDTIFHVKNFFYTVVAKCYKKNMPPINAFCINCNILIKPQSVDAFCTKNFSLMQNASTLPTHFVTKKSKCYNCNIGAKCVVSIVRCRKSCRTLYDYTLLTLFCSFRDGGNPRFTEDVIMILGNRMESVNRDVAYSEYHTYP